MWFFFSQIYILANSGYFCMPGCPVFFCLCISFRCVLLSYVSTHISPWNSLYPRKHKTFPWHLYNVGPTSSTLVPHCTNVIPLFCVCWGDVFCCIFHTDLSTRFSCYCMLVLWLLYFVVSFTQISRRGSPVTVCSCYDCCILLYLSHRSLRGVSPVTVCSCKDCCILLYLSHRSLRGVLLLLYARVMIAVFCYIFHTDLSVGFLLLLYALVMIAAFCCIFHTDLSAGFSCHCMLVLWLLYFVVSFTQISPQGSPVTVCSCYDCCILLYLSHRSLRRVLLSLYARVMIAVFCEYLSHRSLRGVLLLLYARVMIAVFCCIFLTDLSAGFSCSMMEVQRCAVQMSQALSLTKSKKYKPLDFREAFRMATLGGAQGELTITYRIKPELYILWKGRGRRPRPIPRLRL